MHTCEERGDCPAWCQDEEGETLLDLLDEDEEQAIHDLYALLDQALGE
jgi:hypothetical protein